MKESKRTFVYIDGLNLYYRAAREYNIKWLNLYDLCKNKLSDINEILKIKYFTSMVRRSKQDPRKQLRQQIYLRALATIDNLEIIKGNIKQKIDTRPLASNPGEKVKVILLEEKGSDVNLAVHMVNDAHLDQYDAAIIVSNDSDLVGAIEIVRSLGKVVGVLCPSPNATEPLRRVSSFTKVLERNDLRDSEFPRELEDCEGRFHRPEEWD